MQTPVIPQSGKTGDLQAGSGPGRAIGPSDLLPTPAERHRRPLTKAERAAFLEALSNGWAIRHAAVHAGRNWRRFYQLRDRDEVFAAAWADAVSAGTDVLEQEAMRRAVHGVDEPVFQGGHQVGTVRRYSDRLLEFLLRGRRPEVYSDRARLEVTGDGGGPVQVAQGFVPTTLADVARLARELGAETIDGEATETPAELEAS